MGRMTVIPITGKLGGKIYSDVTINWRPRCQMRKQIRAALISLMMCHSKSNNFTPNKQTQIQPGTTTPQTNVSRSQGRIKIGEFTGLERRLRYPLYFTRNGIVLHTGTRKDKISTDTPGSELLSPSR